MRWLRCSVSAAAATALFCLLTPIPPATAQSQQSIPGQSSSQSTDLAAWANTAVRPAAADRPIDLDITSIDSTAVPVDGSVSVKFSLTNTTDQDISDIIVRSEATDSLADPADARTTLIDTASIYVHTTAFEPVVDKLSPQETREFTLEIPVGAPSPTGLGLSEAGVYGFAVNANGRLGDQTQDAFLADARTLLTVGPAAAGAASETETPDSEAPATEPEPGAPVAESERDPKRPAPFTMLWPLTANVNIVPGETGTAPSSPELILKDESLSEEFTDSGRLHNLVTAMATAPKVIQNASCLAIDPVLVSTASRMAKGYVTAEHRPSPVPQTVRLRDSWGQDPNKVDSVPGTGSAAAKSWLTDLRTLAQQMCVVPLPAQSANIDALATINDPSLSLTALAPGATVLDQILEVQSQRSIVIPAAGTVAGPNLRVLKYAGVEPATAEATSRGLAGFDQNFESIITGTEPELSQDVSVLLADAALSRPSGTIGEGITAIGFQAPLGAALAGTGEFPETAPYSPLVSRSFLDDDSAVARMNTAVGILRLTSADATENRRRIVAMPPAMWSASSADLNTWLGAVGTLLHERQVTAAPLHQVLIDESKAPKKATLNSVNNDPNPLPNGHVARAKRLARAQTKLSSIMVNTPDIALTRTGFVTPLRLDVLTAITDRHRRVYSQHSVANNSSTSIVQDSELILQQVDNSVRLLPPGSVYTRASKSTPLMIVASNGLPLPVRAQLQVSAAHAGSSLVDMPQLIPARGSIPLPMPAEEVPKVDSGEFTVTLVTPGKVPISAPVTMSTRSASELLWLVGVIVVLLVAMAWGLARNITRVRQSQQDAPANHGDADRNADSL